MKGKMEASYTVEAAFILPLVFALMYGITFLGFYLHDYTVIEQCAWEGAFFGAGQTGDITSAEVEAYVKERLDNHLLVSDIKDKRIETEGGAVSVELAGEASVPDFIEMLLDYRQKKKINVKRTAASPCASDYVRLGLVIREQLRGLWEEE